MASKKRKELAAGHPHVPCQIKRVEGRGNCPRNDGMSECLAMTRRGAVTGKEAICR